jgi:hypothetical protein
MNAAKRVLIVYYSLTGNTARVARDLAARLDADIESIQDKDHKAGFLGQLVGAFDAWRKTPATIEPIQRDPAGYESILVGTPVWAGQMTPAIRAYLRSTSGKLRNAAFFITSADTDVAKIAPSLEAVAGLRAIASAGFNSRELGDAVAYEGKLATFVAQIPRPRVVA